MLLPSGVDYVAGDAATGTPGTLAVVGSRMTTRLWDGSIALHSVSEDASYKGDATGWPAFGHTEALVEAPIKCGAAAIKWLSGTHLLVGNDKGQVMIWTVAESPEHKFSLTMEGYFEEHTDFVTRIDVSPIERSHFLSASADGSVRLWSLSTNQADMSLAQFLEHTMAVYDVAWSRTNADEFATVSQDQCLKLWDCRAPSKATASTRAPATPRSVAQSASEAHTVAVGCDDGQVALFDRRKLASPVATHASHSRSVVSLAFAPTGVALASAAHDRNVAVLDVTSGKRVYSREGHTDIVTGLAWNTTIPGRLYSVGFDGMIMQHGVQA